MLWLNKNKPELAESDDAAESRFETGHEVGDLARNLFGDYVNVETFRDDGSIDIPSMLSKTMEEVSKQTPNICEAAFSYNGLYCAVDILRRDPEGKDGWQIYEVKSSTHNQKEIYITDVSYQKYVLEHCGLNVIGVFTVCINTDYVFTGELDIHEFFSIADVTVKADEEMKLLPAAVAEAERILASDEEPDIDIGLHCTSPYDCRFRSYCQRFLPAPSVFDIRGFGFSKGMKLYEQGIVSFGDVLSSGIGLNEIQLRQVESYDKDVTFTDKKGIRKFLDTLSYPLYFLDFETMMLSVPKFIGTRPFQQIPFQYSLHYIDKPGGKLSHSEFLGDSVNDPRRGIAESLCRDIPGDVCVTAFNKGFEASCLRGLAKQFPDLADHLLSIAENLKDFLDPFKDGLYYNSAMGGSFSIKSVLPAICPDDPELDYHNLEDVHNGSEAKDIYPLIASMDPQEQSRVRQNLLRYCELDTLAMVKIWEELLRAAD